MSVGRTLALAAVLVVAACGKDKAKAPEPGSGTSTGTGSAVAPAVDCAALLTAGDIAAACEIDAVIVGLEPDEAEEDAGLACRVAVRISGRISMRFVVDTRPMTPAAAKAKLATDDATNAAVGDAGVFVVSQGMAWMNHDLQAVQGKTWFAIKMAVSEKTGAPCSDDGVMTMGKTIAGRLPAP